MKKPRLSLISSQKSHITIEEATEQGLWQIVNQLNNDKKTRETMGLRPLQESINSPPLPRGRPKKT